jgi:hypothetical protein
VRDARSRRSVGRCCDEHNFNEQEGNERAHVQTARVGSVVAHLCIIQREADREDKDCSRRGEGKSVRAHVTAATLSSRVDCALLGLIYCIICISRYSRSLCSAGNPFEVLC